MVSRIMERIYEKIENGERLYVCIKSGDSYIMDAIVPDSIDVEDGIYIEGENLILNISSDTETKIFFDETEEEFVIVQGDITYYLS
jgi:hypothetical protein